MTDQIKNVIETAAANGCIVALVLPQPKEEVAPAFPFTLGNWIIRGNDEAVALKESVQALNDDVVDALAPNKIERAEAVLKNQNRSDAATARWLRRKEKMAEVKVEVSMPEAPANSSRSEGMKKAWVTRKAKAAKAKRSEAMKAAWARRKAKQN